MNVDEEYEDCWNFIVATLVCYEPFIPIPLLPSPLVTYSCEIWKCYKGISLMALRLEIESHTFSKRWVEIVYHLKSGENILKISQVLLQTLDTQDNTYYRKLSIEIGI